MTNVSIHCVICSGIYMPMEHVAATSCGHIYHNECLFQWLNQSPTCPQCRRVCNLGSSKRVYFDFADEEILASTSARASSNSTNAANVANANVETEETIRTLLQQIDEELWKTEEYDHYLADFDSHSEEVSKLNSIIDDDSDGYKVILDAFDNTLAESKRLKESLEEHTRINNQLQAHYNEQVDQVEELNEEIRKWKRKSDILGAQLDKAGKASTASQWDLVQKRNTITELTEKCQSNNAELEQLRETVNKLQLEVSNLKIKFKCQSVDHQVNLSKMHEMSKKIAKRGVSFNLQILKSVASRSTTKYAQNSDINDDRHDDSLIPYCGRAIDEWEFILVPVLKHFFSFDKN